MNGIGLAELADRIRLEPGGWSILIVDEHQIEATTQDMAEELAFLLEDEGAGSVRVLGGSNEGHALVKELSGLKPEDVALLPLPAEVIASVSRSLDYERGRLVGGPRGLLITSEAGLRIFAAEAPSFWSWVGPRVWRADLQAGQLDSEARLASLREGTGLRDEDVLERAQAGTLAPDPIFAEWLILLGRGDLLGH